MIPPVYYYIPSQYIYRALYIYPTNWQCIFKVPRPWRICRAYHHIWLLLFGSGSGMRSLFPRVIAIHKRRWDQIRYCNKDVLNFVTFGVSPSLAARHRWRHIHGNRHVCTRTLHKRYWSIHFGERYRLRNYSRLCCLQSARHSGVVWLYCLL